MTNGTVQNDFGMNNHNMTLLNGGGSPNADQVQGPAAEMGEADLEPEPTLVGEIHEALIAQRYDTARERIKVLDENSHEHDVFTAWLESIDNDSPLMVARVRAQVLERGKQAVYERDFLDVARRQAVRLIQGIPDRGGAYAKSRAEAAYALAEGDYALLMALAHTVTNPDWPDKENRSVDDILSALLSGMQISAPAEQAKGSQLGEATLIGAQAALDAVTLAQEDARRRQKALDAYIKLQRVLGDYPTLVTRLHEMGEHERAARLHDEAALSLMENLLTYARTGLALNDVEPMAAVLRAASDLPSVWLAVADWFMLMDSGTLQAAAIYRWLLSREWDAGAFSYEKVRAMLDGINWPALICPVCSEP